MNTFSIYYLISFHLVGGKNDNCVQYDHFQLTEAILIR